MKMVSDTRFTVLNDGTLVGFNLMGNTIYKKTPTGLESFMRYDSLGRLVHRSDSTGHEFIRIFSDNMVQVQLGKVSYEYKI